MMLWYVFILLSLNVLLTSIVLMVPEDHRGYVRAKNWSLMLRIILYGLAATFVATILFS